MERAEIIEHIRKTISNEGVVIYPWMEKLELTSTELLVFAKLFHALKGSGLAEVKIEPRHLFRNVAISRSQLNAIIRSLQKKQLVCRRTEGKGCMMKSYYSLYENLLNNGNI